jgi:hypothetical protein
MSSPKASMIDLHVVCNVPTWTAMSWLPCMIVSPFTSQSADEKSRA